MNQVNEDKETAQLSIPSFGRYKNRELTFQAVQDIAVGATFLGAGGGGATYPTELQLNQLVKQDTSIKLIDHSDLNDDDLVVACGWLGAPGVQKEKYPSGKEGIAGLGALEVALGRPITAIFPIEIGGQNGVNPLVLAAQTGIPVVDCDGMGRAFPQANMVTFNIYGCNATPAVASDTEGNSVVLNTKDDRTLERLIRHLSIAMGGQCHLFDYPLTGEQTKKFAVKGTISLAWDIGLVIREARQSKCDPFNALFDYLKTTKDYCHVYSLFEGKIVDLERNFRGGFSVGKVTIQGLGQEGQMEVEFQNENLIALQDGQLRAIVPDIISILDQDTAEAINTENLKYGQRVRVVATSISELLRSEKALSVVGPEAFGLSHPFQPVEVLNDSV